jgi:hypothetical protein
LTHDISFRLQQVEKLEKLKEQWNEEMDAAFEKAKNKLNEE